MKNRLLKRLFITATAILFSLMLHAQSTPPPPPINPGDGNHPPVGGDSPIGSGLMMLLMAAGYGAKKVYDARKRLTE